MLTNLDPERFLEVWEDKGRGGKIAYAWLQLCSDLDLTLEEVAELARQDTEIARLVTLYQQKCKASILGALLKDSKNLAKYWELEYATKKTPGEREEWEELSTIK